MTYRINRIRLEFKDITEVNELGTDERINRIRLEFKGYSSFSGTAFSRSY